MSDAKSKIAKALMKDPEWEYGSILPIATRGPREGENYGDVSLALPDMIRDPLASWVKIRDSNFSDYDMQDVLNVMPIPGAAGAAAVPRGALGMMGTKMGKAALDMNPEARLARAADQGFDTAKTWYHGTGQAFDKFNPSSDGALGPGVYLTSDPAEAASWARARSGGGDGNVLSLNTKGKYATVDDQNRYYDATKGQGGERERFAATVAAMIRDGFVGVEDGTTKVVFDPANIRSTSAAFDPSNVGKSGLLLDGSSAVAAIAAALDEDRR